MPSNVEVPLISRSPTKLHAQCVLIPRLFSKMLTDATPWTQTRKPWTVTALTTGRRTNHIDKDNSYHGKQKKKKEKEEVKKKRTLPLFDWEVYPQWSVQLLKTWPLDRMMSLASVPGLRQALDSKPRQHMFITIETASTMAVSHTSSSSPRGSSSSKERTGASMPAWSAAVQRGPTTIRLWYCCEKHFHSLDRSAVIGLITALAAARLGLWSADHNLRLGYEPIREKERKKKRKSSFVLQKPSIGRAIHSTNQTWTADACANARDQRLFTFGRLPNTPK